MENNLAIYISWIFTHPTQSTILYLGIHPKETPAHVPQEIWMSKAAFCNLLKNEKKKGLLVGERGNILLQIHDGILYSSVSQWTYNIDES